MGVIETLIVTTALAGVGGTGLGGLIGAMLQRDSKRTVSLLLSFAGGVMLSVVCCDLILEAIETNMGTWTVALAIAIGVAVTYFLNYLIDKKTNPEVPHIDENHPKTADDLDELIHSDHLEQHYAKSESKLGLFVAGLVMACAIALHNVPEGMTIGASYASNDGVMGSAALVLAVLIGLHNIPEGMAVSVPLISGGMAKWKAVLVTASTGIPTILGALLLGVGRSAGAEFSFFLAIPTMLGASALKLLKFMLSGADAAGMEIAVLAVGCVVSFVVSFLVIKALMEYVRKHSFASFGIYRIVLGVLVLGYFLIAG